MYLYLCICICFSVFVYLYLCICICFSVNVYLFLFICIYVFAVPYVGADCRFSLKEGQGGQTSGRPTIVLPPHSRKPRNLDRKSNCEVSWSLYDIHIYTLKYLLNFLLDWPIWTPCWKFAEDDKDNKVKTPYLALGKPPKI